MMHLTNIGIYMTDIQKNELIAALNGACNALSMLEDASNDAGSDVESQARSMLDTLEDHLRMLAPEAYVVS